MSSVFLLGLKSVVRGNNAGQDTDFQSTLVLTAAVQSCSTGASTLRYRLIRGTVRLRGVVFCEPCAWFAIGVKCPCCREGASGEKGVSSSISLPSLDINSSNGSRSSERLWEASENSRFRAATTARTASSTLRDWKKINKQTKNAIVFSLNSITGNFCGMNCELNNCYY